MRPVRAVRVHPTHPLIHSKNTTCACSSPSTAPMCAADWLCRTYMNGTAQLDQHRFCLNPPTTTSGITGCAATYSVVIGFAEVRFSPLNFSPRTLATFTMGL